MKKQIIFEETSKIHIDKVKETDVIEVIDEGERIGLIFYAEKQWHSVLINGNIRKCNTLTEATEWWMGSEFYVI